MALPKQVQAQLAEAEELEKSLAARQNREDTPEGESETGEAETQGDKTGAGDRQGTAPEGAEPAGTTSTDVADDFEQKYRTLQGKYNAEVPRLMDQVRDLTARLEASEAKAEKSSEPTKPKEKVSYVTDEDRAEFGEELIDVQRRVAREVAEEFRQQIETQQSTIEELRSQLKATGSEVGQMNFAQRLHRLVPDFEAVDSDPRWIAWLNEYDPMLRTSRRVQAKQAFDAGDAEAVADYVKLFKSSTSETSQPTKQRQAELEKQVTPSRTANAPSGQSTRQTAKIYSEREMEAAWGKIRHLNTRGQLDEAAKLEAELTSAYLEGRVR